MAIHSVRRIQSIVRRRFRLLLDLVFARQRSEQRLRTTPVRKVLIVCYGNIYRSPFLAEYLRARLGDTVAVRSSGFHPVEGRSSPAAHVAASARLGVALHDHHSATLTNADLEWADIIVLMDRHNWDAAVQRGAVVSKLVWAGSLTGGAPEIEDPYLLDGAEHDAVLRRLVEAGDHLVAAIRGGT